MQPSSVYLILIPARSCFHWKPCLGYTYLWGKVWKIFHWGTEDSSSLYRAWEETSSYGNDLAFAIKNLMTESANKNTLSLDSQISHYTLKKFEFSFLSAPGDLICQMPVNPHCSPNQSLLQEYTEQRNFPSPACTSVPCSAITIAPVWTSLV